MSMSEPNLQRLWLLPGSIVIIDMIKGEAIATGSALIFRFIELKIVTPRVNGEMLVAIR